MKWIRWMAVRLLALAAIVALVITGYRWAGEGSLSSAVRMLGDDLVVLATCPTEFGRVRDFVRRPVPESGSESSMSQRYGAGWEHEVCDGDLNLRGPAGAERAGPAGAERAGPAAATPTLARIPNLQPQIEAAIEEALGSAPAEGTTLGTAIPRAATPQPASRPRDLPAERHVELKRLMLQLINAERAAVGLMPVALGENAAAQLHAEASLRGCFSSHWGLDGLKPYMRYSLTGGYQANAENGSGLDYCITDADLLCRNQERRAGDPGGDGGGGWRALVTARTSSIHGTGPSTLDWPGTVSTSWRSNTSRVGTWSISCSPRSGRGTSSSMGLRRMARASKGTTLLASRCITTPRRAH